MKRIVCLLFILLISCSKEELKPLFYPYNADQPTTVVANVFIMENARLNFDIMEEETNADYFHRYGIHIDFNLKERRMSLSDEVKFDGVFFIPKKQDTIALYIVPQEYVNVPRAAAYAVVGNRAAVIGDRHTQNRTVSHEIGHILGLGHVTDNNNVMTPMMGASQFERPNNFNEMQIDTMLQRLDILESVELKMIIN